MGGYLVLERLEIWCSAIRKNSGRRMPEFLRIQLRLNATPIPEKL